MDLRRKQQIRGCSTPCRARIGWNKGFGGQNQGEKLLRTATYTSASVDWGRIKEGARKHSRSSVVRGESRELRTRLSLRGRCRMMDGGVLAALAGVSSGQRFSCC